MLGVGLLYTYPLNGVLCSCLQVQTMQDWLTRNRLHRGTLTDLQDNLAAVEEYQV